MCMLLLSFLCPAAFAHSRGALRHTLLGLTPYSCECETLEDPCCLLSDPSPLYSFVRAQVTLKRNPWFYLISKPFETHPQTNYLLHNRKLQQV